jgi:hypothetical protein
MFWNLFKNIGKEITSDIGNINEDKLDRVINFLIFETERGNLKWSRKYINKNYTSTTFKDDVIVKLVVADCGGYASLTIEDNKATTFAADCGIFHNRVNYSVFLLLDKVICNQIKEQNNKDLLILDDSLNKLCHQYDEYRARLSELPQNKSKNLDYNLLPLSKFNDNYDNEFYCEPIETTYNHIHRAILYNKTHNIMITKYNILDDKFAFDVYDYCTCANYRILFGEDYYDEIMKLFEKCYERLH